MACACSCGSGSIGRVLAVVGVVGLGVAGFNTLRTGCPLGTCSTSTSAAAAVTPVASKAGNTPCADTPACEATCPASTDTTTNPPSETHPETPTTSH